MRPQFNTSLTRLIIVGELILVVYLLYTLTVSVYKSYQLDQIIAEYQNENTHIEQQNKKKTEDYDYFTSNNYIEKIAKQNLDLIRPGERVIVMPKLDSDYIVQPNVDNSKNYAQMSNVQIWWSFFFDSAN